MDQLNRVAEQVDQHFSDVSVLIDNVDRRTLIIHTSSDETASQVEAFLESEDVRTTRETYASDDVRVLAVPE
ncbi:MAG: hypothetical protein ABEJ98_03185 [Candidatus Nanohaloarchaea archaeon]